MPVLVVIVRKDTTVPQMNANFDHCQYRHIVHKHSIANGLTF